MFKTNKPKRHSSVGSLSAPNPALCVVRSGPAQGWWEAQGPSPRSGILVAAVGTRADRWVSLLCEQLGRGSPRRGWNLCGAASVPSETFSYKSLARKPVPGAVPVTPCKVAPQAGRLRSPPRASVYLIIGLQNELTRCGILKNMSDHEGFWKLVQEEGHGTEIKEKLQNIKFKMLNPRPQDAPRRREARPLVDADRQDRLCRWRQGLLSQVTEWRKRCQQREDAGRPGRRAPGQGKIPCKTGEKDSRSKIYLRRLYQMYSTSLANMEFSRRLMERDGRFADEHTERRAGGLLDFMVPNEDTGQEEVQPREMGTEDPPPIGRQPGARPALRFLKCQSPASAQRAPHQKTGGRQVALGGM
uniref:uncharacterized protein LOC113185876 n=1 Tax=Urocitellus parryii TaxID=9999 RepID=UPI000E55F22D|nr:uncharacterized protein LOC113185876 [Urocitellus parryii]